MLYEVITTNVRHNNLSPRLHDKAGYTFANPIGYLLS